MTKNTASDQSSTAFNKLPIRPTQILPIYKGKNFFVTKQAILMRQPTVMGLPPR